MKIHIPCPFYVAAALLEASRLYYDNKVSSLTMLGLATAASHPILDHDVADVVREGLRRARALWAAEETYYRGRPSPYDAPCEPEVYYTHIIHQTCTGNTIMRASAEGFEMTRSGDYDDEDSRQYWWADLAMSLEDDAALGSTLRRLECNHGQWGRNHAYALRDVIAAHTGRFVDIPD